MTQETPRFPRIIRLHDGLDAMEEPNRRTLTLLWWGLGVMLLIAIAPHLMLRDFEAALAEGRAEDAEVGTRTLAAFAAGFVLLGTWLATRIYWLKAAVLPRKRQGLGFEYNPIAFAKNVAKLRELAAVGDGYDARLRREALARGVEEFERALSLKDAASYRIWQAYRAHHVQEGV